MKSLSLIPFIFCLYFSFVIPVFGQDFKYSPSDKALYDEIVALDKKYFDAYNNCDMETQAALYAEEIEFYHDNAGLNTSKESILEAIKNNICGKVTRELVEGSIEVYPIPGHGAFAMGLHKFHNNQEPDAIPTPSRFMMVWKKEENTWKITRVISLH